MSRALSLVGRDLRLAFRDPVLALFLILPGVMPLLTRYLIPALLDFLGAEGFLYPLAAPWYPLIGSFILMAVPLLLGSFSGFLLLEDRETGLNAYWAVTPLAWPGYLSWNLAAPWLLCLPFAAWSYYGLPDYPVRPAVAAALVPLLGLFALFQALALLALARNRVEGLAVAKGLSLLYLSAVWGQVMTGPVRWLGGLLPHFWIAEAVVAGGDGFPWATLAGGYLVSGGWILYLIRRTLAKGP